jgi:hypothetical protein
MICPAILAQVTGRTGRVGDDQDRAPARPGAGRLIQINDFAREFESFVCLGALSRRMMTDSDPRNPQYRSSGNARWDLEIIGPKAHHLRHLG